MKKILFRFIFGFCAFVALPVSVYAGKPVSQNFDASQGIYLPLKGQTDAYMLISRDFYTTEFPTK